MLGHKNTAPSFCQLHVSPVSGGFIAVLMDVNGNKASIDRLAYQATHDILTGLPNRTLVLDRIDQAIIHTQRYDFLVAVLYLDIDHLQSLNDQHGPKVGDDILQEVSVRLRKCVRETDPVARVNEDEFVIALPMLSKEEECYHLVKQVMHTLKTPMKIDGVEIVLSGCLGVSFYPYQGMNADTLITHAKIAMERAKKKGQDQWEEFIDDMVLNIKTNKAEEE
jgi:diguanylate cyclase (GGDEF)-like protein